MTDEEARRLAAREQARERFASGDALGWFEVLYAAAGDDAAVIPWADLRPNPHLLALREELPKAAEARALVVGCGLGDDADWLAGQGFAVTAFDIAPTALGWCRRRFPTSGVSWVEADATALPPEWTGGFDLVFEAYTLQAVPAALRARIMAELPRVLAPGGRLLLVCRGREADEPASGPPWPLTRDDLAPLVQAGLSQVRFEALMDPWEATAVRRFRALYARG